MTGVQMQEEQRQDGSAPASRLETPLTEQRFPGVMAIQKEFLNTKRCLCVIPVSWCEEKDEFAEVFRKFPERLALAAVAVGDNDQAIGFVQMSMQGLQTSDERMLHSVGAGEAYIYTMAVLDGHRGKGALPCPLLS